MALANTVTAPPQAESFGLKAKVSLVQRGMTVTALAKRLRLARNTVSIAINHPTMFPRVKQRISRHLGIEA